MQPSTNTSQDKIKVHLEILPGKLNPANVDLAAQIAEEIFERFDQIQGYSVEPSYKEEMGGGSEYWIWIAPSVVFIGETFVHPFAAKLAERAADKVANQLGEFLENIRKRQHGKLDTDIKIQSPSRVEAIIHTEALPPSDE